MSGLVSGITKVFTSLGTGVATLGNAVRGVGASLFTGMAATGKGLTAAAAGGGASLFGGGGGVLGNMLTGALKTGLTGGLIGGVVGAVTGQGFGKGALYGGLGGAAFGALGGAMSGGNLMSNMSPAAAAGTGVDPVTTGAVAGAPTPTGAAPVIGGGRFGPGSRGLGGALDRASVAGYAGGAAPAAAATVPPIVTPPVVQQQGGGTLLDKLLGSEGAMNIAGGALQGFGTYKAAQDQVDAAKDMQQAQLDYLRQQAETVRAGYRGTAASAAGGRTPGQWYYNGQTGQVEQWTGAAMA